MMSIQEDISALKDKGLSDQGVADMVKLKGFKPLDIETQLNQFYANHRSTRYIIKEKESNISLVIIVTMLLILAVGLGLVILYGIPTF